VQCAITEPTSAVHVCPRVPRVAQAGVGSESASLSMPQRPQAQRQRLHCTGRKPGARRKQGSGHACNNSTYGLHLSAKPQICSAPAAARTDTVSGDTEGSGTKQGARCTKRATPCGCTTFRSCVSPSCLPVVRACVRPCSLWPPASRWPRRRADSPARRTRGQRASGRQRQGRGAAARACLPHPSRFCPRDRSGSPWFKKKKDQTNRGR
jgi:hypothetical protein